MVDPHLSEPFVSTDPHLSEVRAVAPDPPYACVECLRTGQQWVSLRQCLICGHVGCCNSSPGKHATAHFRETRHPVMRSIRPGQDWGWCYVHEVYIRPRPEPRPAAE